MTNTKTSNAKSTDHTAKSAKPQPWEQQPQESDLHYSYFVIYRDLPTTIRTVKKVKETLHDNGKDLTHEYLRMVSADNKWQQRVRAWDKHTQSLMLTSKESTIKEMNNKHANIANDCIDLVYDELMNDELKKADPNKRPYLIQALIRGMEGAVRIQRLALGESTSNTKQVNEGINNLMMVLTDSKKQLQKQQKKNDIIDIEGEVIQSEK
jgi:hypothetical protein